MLDRYARPYVNGVFQKIARGFLDQGLKPNQITLAALIVGLLAGLSLAFNWTWLALILLWLSGLLDAVDGEMARLSGTSSLWGAQLDIVFDRLVELAIIWGLAYRHPEARPALIGLLSAILISMTVFLTSGMYAPKKGNKAFYYQAGLMERTEGFIAFSLMMIFRGQLVVLTWIYAALIVVTIGQRLWEAHKLLSGLKNS